MKEKQLSVSPGSHSSVGSRPNREIMMSLLDVELIKRPSISTADKLHYLLDHMQ